MLQQARTGGNIPISPSAALPHQVTIHTHCHSPHSQPSAACALLTGLTKKATLQGGSKRSWGQQAFLNFFVSLARKFSSMQQHGPSCSQFPLSCGRWGHCRGPGCTLSYVTMGCSVTWQWPSAACPCWLGTKVCFTRMVQQWRWKCSQHP